MLTKLPLPGRRVQRIGCAVLALIAALPAVSFAQYLVSNQDATRLGLERAWFAQVRVNPARHKVAHWLLDNDRLFALTSDGVIQSFNAETGKKLWITEVGEGHAPAARIAVNSEYVALLGAGRLYVLARADGRHLWSRQVGGAASAAPALSNKYAYVALLNGRVEGYRLDDPTANVWQYQSHGRNFQSPSATGQVVSWPSDRGMLYVGQADRPRVLFRVETNDEIVAPPAEQEPYLYVASLDGYLYCFHELTGSEQWRYATGFAVTSQPAIVGETAFVASEEPSLHAVNALNGQPLWRLDGATQFVALGKQHTYSTDRYGTLIVLDNNTGGIAGQLDAGEGNSALVNDKSDRIFLISDRGLVQCLHEIGATEPTWHRAVPEADVAEDAISEEGVVIPADDDTQDFAPADGEAEQPSDSPFEVEGEAEEAEFEGFGF